MKINIEIEKEKDSFIATMIYRDVASIAEGTTIVKAVERLTKHIKAIDSLWAHENEWKHKLKTRI